jgi:hypothetical protein
MNNPYSPPDAEVRAPAQNTAKSARVHPLISVAIWLIFALGVLQIWGVMLFLLREYDVLAEAIRSGAMSYFSVALVIVQPTALFFGGVLLLFRRKLASLGFAIWLVCVFGAVLIDGRPPMFLSVLINVGALALTLYLHKRGQLR